MPIEYRLLLEIVFDFDKKFLLLLVRKTWQDDLTYKKLNIICIPRNENVSEIAKILSSGKLSFIIVNLSSSCCGSSILER